jgi:hypothetical protein
VKKTRQNKKESLRSDSIGTEKALERIQAKPARIRRRRFPPATPCGEVAGSSLSLATA